MEENKNHWTKKKIEEAKKRINEEVYKRDRQTSIHIKLDNLAIIINNSITRLIEISVFFLYKFM